MEGFDPDMEESSSLKLLEGEDAPAPSGVAHTAALVAGIDYPTSPAKEEV